MPPPKRGQVETQYAKAAHLMRNADTHTTTMSATARLLRVTGAHDALAWVLGLTPCAPLSGRDLPDPDTRDLFGEWARAEARLDGVDAVERGGL